MEFVNDGNLSSGFITVFGAPVVNATNTKTIDAVVDIDKYGQLFGVEILWLKDQLGESDANKLMQRLGEEGMAFSYDDEVDILHFSLATDIPYINNILWAAELTFNEATLNAFYLKPRLPT